MERSNTEAEFSTSEHAAALVVGLISAVSKHDRLTRGHSERVRAYSDLIGEELGLDAESRSKLHWAALLHDVGKLAVPAAILNKTERLTDDEWKIIRDHPAASEPWIAPVRDWLGDWARAASEHHERYDGDGYPDGLSGDAISLAGRIVSVADAFDVMTAARSYKKPYPAAQARVELANNAGTQFDPRVVRAFLAISLRKLRLVMGPLAWLSGLSGLFSVGSIASGTAAAVTAAAVAATALAGPAVASPVKHGTRSTVSSGAHASAGGGSTDGGTGSSGTGSGGGVGAGVGAAKRTGSPAVNGTGGNVPVTPIGDPTDPGTGGGNSGGGSSTTPATTRPPVT